MTLQFSYITTAVPAGAPWPTLQLRDSSIGPPNPLAALYGLELIPGDIVSMECEETDIQNNVYIDPTEFWVMLAAVGNGTVHMKYGVLS